MQGLFSADARHGIDLCRLQLAALCLQALERGLEILRGQPAAEDQGGFL